MSQTILNQNMYARTLFGVINLSDGVLEIENGNITNANSLDVDYLNSTNIDISGNLIVEGNFNCGLTNANSHIVKGKMTFFDTLPECGLALTTANQLVNKNYTDTNFVYKTGSISETITGIKTFSVPPENSSTITTNSQLTNKLYVDTKFNSIDLSNYVTLNTAQTGISGNKTFSGTNTHTGANTFTNDGNTFNTTSSNFTLTNPAFTAFTGFTAPVYPTMRYLVSAGTATGNYTNNGWTWIRGNTNCEILWSAGNNGLEYYGGPPPGYSYCVFNRAVAGSVFYQEQQNLTFTAGKQYVLKFWSYWGWVNAYSGGSRTGLITVSIGNSTDTYVYNDQDTRVALTWRQHIFRFSVTSTTTTGYIRFTATDTATAGQFFPFALGGITLREYSSVKLTDTSQSLNSFIAGDFNLQRNLFTQNLYGTGDFGTSSGRGTFYAPSPNINCLCINNNTFNTGTSYNCIAIGKASYFVANAANDCINIGNYQNLVSDANQVSKAGNQMIEIGNNHEGASANGSILIGHYIRQLKPLVGYSVAIGNQIGAGGTDNTTTGYGVGSRTIAIGYGIFSGNADPFSRPSPDYSVMIGYLAGRNNGDFYNCGIGSFALNSMNGVAGMIPGYGTTQFNTALGYQAGRNQTDLNRCTLIGANTDNTANSLTDTTALGYNAKCGANFSTSIGSGVVNNVANSVRIGRSSDSVRIDGSFNLMDLTFPSLSQNSTIAAATTISTPYYEYYSVNAGATAFTITLPTITINMLGKKIIFRRVGGTTTTIVSFVGNGTQKVYNTLNTGGAAAQALMGSGEYIVSLVPLVDGTAGTYAYFEI